MLHIELSYDHCDQLLAGEVALGEALHLVGSDAADAFDALGDEAVCAAAEDVLDRYVGNAERTVEDAVSYTHLTLPTMAVV